MEFITANGNKKVEIKMASFRDANNLKKVIMKSLGENIKDLEGNLLEMLPKILIELETSAEFESAITPCLSICIYDGFHKITPQLFDDFPDARQDYYEILTNCVEFNLRPLWQSLVTELKRRMETIKTESPVLQ